MNATIFANGTNPELIALINAAPYARDAADRHHRDVLDVRPHDAGNPTHRQQVADNNALNNAAAEALDRVAVFPASTAADLHTKLSFMAEHDMGDGFDWVPTLLGDVERITAEGKQS